MSIFRVPADKFKAIKGISAARQADLQLIKAKFDGSSSNVQCQRLLIALTRYKLTTFEAMRFLDVYHCPARIFQLRKLGYKITTHWETVVTESGEKHVVGCYTLNSASYRSASRIDVSMYKLPTQLLLPFDSKISKPNFSIPESTL